MSEVIGRHLLSSFRETDGSSVDAELNRRILKYSPKNESANVQSSPIVKIKNDEVLELIKKKKYAKAVELAKMRKLNPFSLFNGVQAFGKVYDNIPFIAAALAVASDKRSKDESTGEKMAKVLTEVFRQCGTNSKNMFDAKFNTPSGCNDILTFILTRDGEVKGVKKYDHDLDLDALVLLSSILRDGYTLGNTSNFTKYVFENDLVSTLKFMIENGMYSPSMDSIEAYGIKPISNIGKLISTIAAHPFKLHAPEMEYDDKGKFAGGTLYEAFKRAGYDISKIGEKEDAQQLHPSFIWMIKDAILNAYVNYCNNGENFTNSSDVCFSDGSKFMEAVDKLLYLCSEYKKFIDTYGNGAFSGEDRNRYLSEIVKSVNIRLIELQDGLNEILERLGLPKIILTLKNPLDDKDENVAYKAVNFMKEVWDSIKSGRRRQQRG
jgi:hypothetical protein